MSTQTPTKKIDGRSKEARAAKKAALSSKRRRKFDETAFYKKYPHVVEGSVKDVPVNQVVDGVTSHGRLCKIKCQAKDCTKTRLVNTQDVFQVKFCQDDQKSQSRASAKDAPKRKIRKAS